jgi:hypothetical protein
MKWCMGFDSVGLTAKRAKKIPINASGVTQVCFNAYRFHLRNRDLAFRRLENGLDASLSVCAWSILVVKGGR